MRYFAFLLIVCALAAAGVRAQPVRVEAVEVELVSARTAAVPGQPLALGLRMRHDPQWHTYWRNPGDSGLPTKLALTLPEGWRAGGIDWPAPHRIFVGPLANYGYDGDLLLPVVVNVPASAPPGRVRLAGKASWLMCKEVCIPGEASVALELPVQPDAQPSAHAPAFERSERLTPRERLPVRFSQGAGAISLAFDATGARRAEFFPYGEGAVSAPAPQSLYRIGDERSTAMRLELKLADGADAAAVEKAGLRAGRAGVLMVDGRPFEADVVGVDAPGASGAPSGTLIATAAGEDLSRGAGGGLGSRLLGAAGAGSPGAGSATAAAAPEGLTLAAAAAFAVLGGLILNLMPCVFPVIGLKVLSFAGDAGAHRDETRRNALAFGAGVLASFWGLAALLLALRAAGQAVGWGFQLQSPPFVALMALLFVGIGMNLAGVYEIGAGLTRLGELEAPAARRGGTSGAFASGALAVLVATPCTAPFMGSALGFTLGGSAAELVVVFSALALGMALPYLALGWFPRALAWLPRPGRWMESFRQLLAFPMFATFAWLAWVLGQQSGVDAVLGLALGAVLVALATWLFGRFVQSARAVHRPFAAALAVAALAAGVWLAWPDETAPAGAPAAASAGPARAGADGWQPWSDDGVAQALTAGRPVFVDFTAAWCVSCQVNKKLVLEREPVNGEMQRRNVVRLRADWTHRDAAITAALARHGRNGVPLYLLYVPGEPAPRVLPELLTGGIVMQALAVLR